MRAVVITGPSTLELNWMWLPFFCSDSRTKAAIEKALGPELVGKPLTDETLDWAHERVLDLLCERHHAIVGLRDYLDSLKYVEGPRG